MVIAEGFLLHAKKNKYIRIIIMDLQRIIISLHAHKRPVLSAEKSFGKSSDPDNRVVVENYGKI